MYMNKFVAFSLQWTVYLFDDRRRIAHSTNKVRTYRNILLICQNRSNRQALALFRCGCAPIALETGRYQNVNKKKDYVSFVIQVIIEDEFHCFMSCSANNYHNFLMSYFILIQFSLVYPYTNNSYIFNVIRFTVLSNSQIRKPDINLSH